VCDQKTEFPSQKSELKSLRFSPPIAAKFQRFVHEIRSFVPEWSGWAAPARQIRAAAIQNFALVRKPEEHRQRRNRLPPAGAWSKGGLDAPTP
jgi:hypothetical protein